ncbi:SixA phosphatase family protein [Crocinitomix algicola]|uniref:SixA phosphatase family protein n=1 Tax=Crocinitomix algicola TaxID=1740263 RepID=UPI000873154E|nr:histidine phosphatase family protein [Crocinitomix algicola]
MLKLFVLRHGKATRPERDSPDFSRRLNRKGNAQVNQVGYILHEEKVKIDTILSSSATRTSQTAEIMKYHLNSPQINFFDDLYLADCSQIVKFINVKAKGDAVLLVGHNFGLSDTVNYLSNDNLLLSTSMLVQINFNFDDWKYVSKNTGEITRIIEPKVHTF